MIRVQMRYSFSRGEGVKDCREISRNGAKARRRSCFLFNRCAFAPLREICESFHPESPVIHLWASLCFVASLALFVLPFHRPRPNMAPPRDEVSLMGVCRKLLKGIRGDKPRRALLRVGAVLLLVTTFFPALILVEANALSERNDVGLRLALAGQAVLLVGGAVFTVIVQVFSNLVIGFGSSRTAQPTFVAALLPIYQIGFAIAAFLLSLWHY